MKQTLIKAIEIGIFFLIDQVAAVIFVKLTKVSDFGTPKRFCINSINISTNTPGAAQWQPLLFSKKSLIYKTSYHLDETDRRSSSRKGLRTL